MKPNAEFFYCPYCSEENLFPADEDAWHCACCLRTFVVTLTSYGLSRDRHTEGVNRLDLVGARSRQLTAGDPQGRQPMLSCGAALHHAPNRTRR